MQLSAVAATKRYRGEAYFNGDYVDTELFANWKVKARHLLSIACGETSEHYREFVARQDGGGYSTNHTTMIDLKAVFEAAREDFDGGYLSSIRSIVQAEVFSSELEQARELVKGGYLSPAAVIAGVVLETTLRRLCEDASLPVGSLNRMNADLVKAGCYTLLVNKRITVWADIRNSAAHGKADAFSSDDVEDMIDKVEAFVADHL